uniref:Ionotropic glutamate receptor C-terminal domain-containing protein n=1 Tax=Anopheles maculatus TaxID=74869 RepID=A0A182S6P1_9DIPT
MLAKVFLLLLYLSVASEADDITLPDTVSLVVQRECETPGIIDLRVLPDESLDVQQYGTCVKRSANYDWGAKYLFYLPSISANQLANFTALAAVLTGHRLYNNLFVINRQLLVTFDVLNGTIHHHARLDLAVSVLFQDKFRQMHRYQLEDVVDAEIYPFHFVIYGQMKLFGREAHFITMLADRINLSMVERVDQLNMVFNSQFKDRLKDNSIVATYGHTLGDFRRIYTNDMEGICAVTQTANTSTIIDAFVDPFDRYIWMLWLVCSELTAIMWTFLKWGDSTTPRTVVGWFREFGELHMILLQCCVLAPPDFKYVRNVERLLACVYIITVFNIVTVYVSIVTSNLSTVRYGNDLKTVHSLVDHQTLILGSETHLQVLRQSERSFNIGGEADVTHYIVYLLHKESILQEVLE